VKPVRGLLDKTGGRRCHLLLNKRTFFSPFCLTSSSQVLTQEFGVRYLLFSQTPEGQQEQRLCMKNKNLCFGVGARAALKSAGFATLF
jgi:hypothetical protein